VKEGSLYFTQSGLSTPTAAGVVVERGSEYILAHTGPRELDAPPGGVWVGVSFSSRLYYPFGKGPGQHIIRCLKYKKCENEQFIFNRSPREGVDTCRDRALYASGRGYYGQANSGRAAKATHGTQVPS